MAAALLGGGKNLKEFTRIVVWLVLSAKCQCAGKTSPLQQQQQQQAMKQSSLLREKRILWLVGWLVGW
jgi:hypothetical protein